MKQLSVLWQKNSQHHKERKKISKTNPVDQYIIEWRRADNSVRANCESNKKSIRYKQIVCTCWDIIIVKKSGNVWRNGFKVVVVCACKKKKKIVSATKTGGIKRMWRLIG